MKLLFWNRDFTDMVAQPRVEWEIGKYDASEQGGPQRLPATASGDAGTIASLLYLIACPVSLIDDDGEELWWGMVHGVYPKVGAWSWGYSVTEIANRVKVAYTSPDPNAGSSAGSRSTTGWVDDLRSRADYGDLELIVPATNVNATAANNIAQRNIDVRAFPVQPVSFAQSTGRGVRATADIDCVGWSYRLSRRYWTSPALYRSVERVSGEVKAQYDSKRVEYRYVAGAATPTEITENRTINVGCSTYGANQTEKMYFQFPAPSIDLHSAPVRLRSVRLKMAKIGSPTDEYRLTIGASPGGQVLATFLVDAASVNTAHTWTSFSSESTSTDGFIPGVTYFATLERTGALSNANYLRVCGTSALNYAPGVTRLWTGAAWAVNPGGDMDTLFDAEFDLTDTAIAIGADIASGRIYQVVNSPDGVNAVGEIRVNMSKIGTPTDNMIVEVWPYASIGFGSPITTISVPATVVQTAEREIIFQASAWPELQALTAHAIVIKRSGASDIANYVRVHVKPTVSAPVIARWTGAAYVESNDQSTLHKVSFVRETTRQIAEIVESLGSRGYGFGGPFINGCVIEANSGVYTNPFADGDKDGLRVINTLLASGTADGRRLLYRISPARYMHVFAEPVSSDTEDLYLDSSGSLTSWARRPYKPQRVPVARWLRFRESTADEITSAMIGVNLSRFVKSARYDPKTNTYEHTPRGIDDIEDFFRVSKG